MEGNLGEAGCGSDDVPRTATTASSRDFQAGREMNPTFAKVKMTRVKSRFRTAPWRELIEFRSLVTAKRP